MRDKKYAQVRPPGPPPITAIFFPVLSFTFGFLLNASAWSTAYLFIPHIFTASSTIFLLQLCSHGCSHTYPHTDGNGLSFLIISTASSYLPARTSAIYP